MDKIFLLSGIWMTGSGKSGYIYMLVVFLQLQQKFRRYLDPVGCWSIGIFVVQVFSGFIFAASGGAELY